MTSADSGEAQGLGIEPADAVDFVPADQAVAPSVPGAVPPPGVPVPSAPDTAASDLPGEQSIASVPNTTAPDRPADPATPPASALPDWNDQPTPDVPLAQDTWSTTFDDPYQRARELPWRAGVGLAGLVLHRPKVFLIGLVAVIVVAVVAVLAIRALPARQPTAAPSGPTWSGPWQSGVSSSMAQDLGLGDVIVIQPMGGHTLTGFDLVTKQVTFSLTPDELTEPSGDATGFVAIVGGQLEAVDPTTGRLLGQAPVPASTRLMWAGHGLILTESASFTLCARTMADPGTCLWTADSTPASYQNVFGDGRWVNTGAGVVDLATGQPAGFGQDSGLRRSPTGDSVIYYDGASPDRVFRVVGAGGFTVSGDTTYQSWDVTTDQATSPFLSADRVVTDPGLPVFMGITSEIDVSNMTSHTVATAYTWPDGNALWHQTTSILGGDFEQFVNGDFLTSINTTTGWVNEPAAAFDATTGATVWQSSLNADDFYGRLGNLVFMVDNETLVAYDATNNYQVAWRSTLPKLATAWCLPGVAGTHIYCTGVDGLVYLLDL